MSDVPKEISTISIGDDVYCLRDDRVCEFISSDGYMMVPAGLENVHGVTNTQVYRKKYFEKDTDPDMGYVLGTSQDLFYRKADGTFEIVSDDGDDGD